MHFLHYFLAAALCFLLNFSAVSAVSTCCSSSDCTQECYQCTVSSGFPCDIGICELRDGIQVNAICPTTVPCTSSYAGFLGKDCRKYGENPYYCISGRCEDQFSSTACDATGVYTTVFSCANAECINTAACVQGTTFISGGNASKYCQEMVQVPSCGTIDCASRYAGWVDAACKAYTTNTNGFCRAVATSYCDTSPERCEDARVGTTTVATCGQAECRRLDQCIQFAVIGITDELCYTKGEPGTCEHGTVCGAAGTCGNKIAPPGAPPVAPPVSTACPTDSTYYPENNTCIFSNWTIDGEQTIENVSVVVQGNFSLSDNSTLTIATSAANLIIQGCTTLGGFLNLSAPNLPLGNTSIDFIYYNSNCLSGAFAGININSNSASTSACGLERTISATPNFGPASLSVLFEVTQPECSQPTDPSSSLGMDTNTLIGVVIGSVGGTCFVLGVLVMVIPQARRRIFPHRRENKRNVGEQAQEASAAR